MDRGRNINVHLTIHVPLIPQNKDFLHRFINCPGISLCLCLGPSPSPSLWTEQAAPHAQGNIKVHVVVAEWVRITFNTSRLTTQIGESLTIYYANKVRSHPQRLFLESLSFSTPDSNGKCCSVHWLARPRGDWRVLNLYSKSQAMGQEI